MKQTVVIFFSLIVIVVAELIWFGNKYVSNQYASCVFPSRITNGEVVIGNIASIKDAGDEMIITLELCGESFLFISPRLTIVSPSGFIIVGKKQEDGYYWSNVRAKEFISDNLHRVVAVRSGFTQNMLIKQTKKSNIFQFMLPALFLPPVLQASEYVGVSTLTEAQKMISEGSL